MSSTIPSSLIWTSYPSHRRVSSNVDHLFCKFIIFVLFVETKKRKSDEAAAPGINDVFKSPYILKKMKHSSGPDLKASASIAEPAIEYQQAKSSQSFLLSCENNNSRLTQTSDCVMNFADDDNFISVITNPLTCSQYCQLKSEVDIEKNDSLDDLFNSTDKEDNSAKFSEVQSEKKGTVNALNTTNAADMSLLANIDWEDVEKNSLPKNPVKLSDSTDKANKTLVKENQQSFNTKPRLLPVSSEKFMELGPFFGLTRHHKEFILKTKNIEKLYDWQEECLRLSAILNRKNLIYALPTSGGKTLVAEIAMLREVILRKRNVIFILPYVSIVQEKVQDLMPFATEFKFIVEEYCAGKGTIPPTKRRKKNVIYICTMEKAHILYDSLHENKRLEEVGLIVVDELHMVGDASRGHTLETVLTKAVFNTSAGVQIIGMSATISNLNEIATFLKADVYTRDFRPIELKEFIKIGSDILAVDAKAQLLSEAFKLERTIAVDCKPHIAKRDPDQIAALVLEVIPTNSCLVFCATKQNCESVAILLTDILPSDHKEIRKEEKISLIEAIRADSSGRICPILEKTILFGIAYHHSGLTNDERKHLEEAYRLNIICVICCTSTLAAGVNLPAARVIIRSPYVGKNLLTLTRYKQMVGRAGRAGKCETGESIMIVNPRDHQQILSLLCSKMDETVSAFVQDEQKTLIQNAVLNLLGNKLATSIDDLVGFFQRSLLHVQIERTLVGNLRKIVAKAVEELLTEKALDHISATNGLRHASMTIKSGHEEIEVFPDDTLEVSKLGKAAVKAGISLNDAQELKENLRKAAFNLMAYEFFHLLFIVAPEDISQSINYDSKNLNNVYMKMNESMLHAAKTIGVSEGLAMKLITRPNAIKPSEKRILQKFYVALMLHELWNMTEVHIVATRYKVNRGTVQGLMQSASSRAYCIFKFCEEYDEFFVFHQIMEMLAKRLAYCCSAELLPLMELPSVKIVSFLFTNRTDFS